MSLRCCSVAWGRFVMSRQNENSHNLHSQTNRVLLGERIKGDEMDWASITNCRKLEIHIKFRYKTEEKMQLGRGRNIAF
jgi:hypothetical protein